MRHIITSFWSVWFTLFCVGLYNHFNSGIYGGLIVGAVFGLLLAAIYYSEFND